jgi:hypothetical protein
LLAAGASLKQADVKFEDAVAVYGGIGFGLYLLGRILDVLSTRLKSLTVWLTPLTHSSITLTALAVVINLPTVMNHMTATAATLAFAGALYVAIAYRGRVYRLGYLGMALLEVAWVLALIINDVHNHNGMRSPAGCTSWVWHMEWRNNKQIRHRTGDMDLITVVTSFAQSLNGENDCLFRAIDFEGLLAIWWGVLQKERSHSSRALLPARSTSLRK